MRRLVLAFPENMPATRMFAGGPIMAIFYLVSVAEETGLSLALSDIPKTDFVATRPNYILLALVLDS